jgi:hypothetical protein
MNPHKFDPFAALERVRAESSNVAPVAEHGPPQTPNRKQEQGGRSAPFSMSDGADWAYAFHERAGFLEYDCHVPRHDAERRALDELQARWRALHPMPPSDHDSGCVQCGGKNGSLVPHLARDRSHFWLHPACWPAFDKARRAEAMAALCDMIPGLPGRP